MQPMRILRRIVLVSGVSIALSGGAAQAQQAAEVIKIGILHSLNGEMSLSETSLKDSLKMLVQLQNKNGGLLGREIVAIQRDPASDPEVAAQLARELIEEEGVVAIFGCWTSSCRKSVRSVVEELNGLLFYPVQYEGQESSRNIIYTGATPNQQALPAVDFLMGARRIERWVLLGSDYVYPRVTNGILSAYLRGKGVAAEDILVRYASLEERDWHDAVAEIVAFGSQGKRAAVVSTINGESNIYFYQEVARAQISARDIPIMAFSVGEEELVGLDTAPLAGHLAAWNYFMSVDNAFNRTYIKLWQNFAQNPRRVTKDPMEAQFIGFRLWVKAVEQAQSTKIEAVLKEMVGLSVDNLSGGIATVLPNHHITKPAFVGEIQGDGQFKVVWESPETIAADAWSDYLPSTAKLTADWRPPVSCGRYNTVTESCEGFVGE